MPIKHILYRHDKSIFCNAKTFKLKQLRTTEIEFEQTKTAENYVGLYIIFIILKWCIKNPNKNSVCPPYELQCYSDLNKTSKLANYFNQMNERLIPSKWDEVNNTKPAQKEWSMERFCLMGSFLFFEKNNTFTFKCFQCKIFYDHQICWRY